MDRVVRARVPELPLGVRAIRAPDAEPATLHESQGTPTHHQSVVRDGFVVALFNPKTVLFFAAFLPQFVSRSGSTSQSVLLGAVFVGIAAMTDSVYALVAGAMAPVFVRARPLRVASRYFTGATFLMRGLLSALVGHAVAVSDWGWAPQGSLPFGRRLDAPRRAHRVA
jgi:threonine/homoserine/homoserine lactone efflux protein